LIQKTYRPTPAHNSAEMKAKLAMQKQKSKALTKESREIYSYKISKYNLICR